MKIPDFLLRFISRTAANKLGLEDGPMDDTKKWYKSRTVWAGVYMFLRGTYEGVQQFLAPNFGWTLPPIPPIVDTVVGAFVGGLTIQGRAVANTKITL